MLFFTWVLAAVGDLPPPPNPLTVDHGWPAGTIEEQLNRDETLVPYGKGALFIPALTNPLDEPIVSVFFDGHEVAQAPTGTRVVLDPGRYSLQLGSGSVDQRFVREVTVREQHTTVVPVTWAGLVVHVVDDRLNSLRASYEIIRMDDREYLGVGFGSNEQAGEPVATWILQPGLYKIVKVGESYRARSNFATVRIETARLTDYVLVVDPDTGDFKGAGEATGEEFFRSEEGLRWSLVLGGDVSLNSKRNIIGSPNGETYAFRAFLDTKINVPVVDNPLILQLQIEQGQTKTIREPWQKTRDRVDFDGLYVYHWYPWLGPYLRFGVETNLFRGWQFFDEPRDIAVFDPETGTRRERLGVSRLQLSPSFGLTEIKEGVGVNLRMLKALFAELTIRTGVGARHRIARDLLEPDNDSDTPERDYRLVPSVHQVGVEATLLALFRITRWVVLSFEVNALMPFNAPQEILLGGEASLIITVTQYFSVNYVLRYLRDPTLVADYQLEQDALLRFSLALP